MTTEEALNRHFAAAEILDPGCTRKDWYAGHMISLKLGGVRVPFFPILRRSGPIVRHDLHHMLMGYAPDWTGECELAGWELGSGGCRWHLFYWFDRLTLFLLGLLTTPARTLRAFARGRRGHNLYGRGLEPLLRADVEELRAQIAG